MLSLASGNEFLNG